MKKIIPKKRNFKKKVAKKSKRVKIVFPSPPLMASQWGEAFEKLAHREPLTFNMLKGVYTESKKSAGDPFSVVDFLREGQMRINERQSDMLDALRYSKMGLNSQCTTGVCGTDALVGNEERPTLQNAPERLKAAKAAEAVTRGELGTAPAHYTHGKIEPWDVVKDWGLDYFTGCAMKYVCRHKHKGTPEQDIQKAIDYLVEYKKTLSQETK